MGYTRKALLRWGFLVMLSIIELISLFKKIGDAWIKGMWARKFQMRGSVIWRETTPLFWIFALHQDVRARTLKSKLASCPLLLP